MDCDTQLISPIARGGVVNIPLLGGEGSYTSIILVLEGGGTPSFLKFKNDHFFDKRSDHPLPYLGLHIVRVHNVCNIFASKLWRELAIVALFDNIAQIAVVGVHFESVAKPQPK